MSCIYQCVNSPANHITQAQAKVCLRCMFWQDFSLMIPQGKNVCCCGNIWLCFSCCPRYLKTDRTDPMVDPATVVTQFLNLVTHQTFLTRCFGICPLHVLCCNGDLKLNSPQHKSRSNSKTSNSRVCCNLVHWVARWFRELSEKSMLSRFLVV